MLNHAQVLAVGAGPVGLTLANELVRHGVSVRIIDKAARRTDKSKALVLWRRSLGLRLIRPDGYVGYAGSAKDPLHAEAYLSTLAAK
jgi:cation diffusion facilitator CzcD-associated flavoprotein CzcO